MPDIGAGARVGARMLILEQLTLIWRHLELEPVAEVFCTVCTAHCAGIRPQFHDYGILVDIKLFDWHTLLDFQLSLINKKAL